MNVYWLIVDYHRWIFDQHNTKGAYLVKAKNEKDAKRYLQKIIGFGSIESQGVITKDNMEKNTEVNLKNFSNKKNMLVISIVVDWDFVCLIMLQTIIQHGTLLRKNKKNTNLGI